MRGIRNRQNTLLERTILKQEQRVEVLSGFPTVWSSMFSWR
jgi:hypothetical protein